MTARKNRPYVECYAYYHRIGQGDSFLQIVSGYLQFGYVVSFPEVFACARPVDHRAARELIDDWSHDFGDSSDCWHLALASGNLAKLFPLMPHPLPKFSFHRIGIDGGGRLRVFDISHASRFVQVMGGKQ